MQTQVKTSASQDVGASVRDVPSLVKRQVGRAYSAERAVYRQRTSKDAHSLYSEDLSLSDSSHVTPEIVTEIVQIKNNLVSLFFSAQEWDGYVAEMHKSHFRGVIYPVGLNNSNSEEFVDIPLEFVDEGDLQHIGPGSIFRLATGRFKRRRQSIQATQIYFRKKLRPDDVSDPVHDLDLGDLFADWRPGRVLLMLAMPTRCFWPSTGTMMRRQHPMKSR